MSMTFSAEETLQINVGEKAHYSKTIDKSEFRLFSDLAEVLHPAQANATREKDSKAANRMAQSTLIVGLANGVLHNQLPGRNFQILRQQLEFINPVFVGDTVTIKVEVISWSPEKRLVTMKMDCANQKGNDLLTGESVMILKPGTGKI